MRLRTYIAALARRSKETPESCHRLISISVDGLGHPHFWQALWMTLIHTKI